MLALRINPSALDEMFNLTGELDKVFGTHGTMQRQTAWTPSVEVQETEDFVSMAVELPGVSQDDVTLSVENGLLTIAGEKKPARHYANGASLRYSERWYGRFQRTFALPAGVEAGRIEAACDAGILTIRLYKSEQAKARRIPIAFNTVAGGKDAQLTSGQK